MGLHPPHCVVDEVTHIEAGRDALLPDAVEKGDCAAAESRTHAWLNSVAEVKLMAQVQTDSHVRVGRTLNPTSEIFIVLIMIMVGRISNSAA
jgi:hypothetical protein